MTDSARNAAREQAVRLPGQSPCTFDGADGWKTCLAHGWSGPESQRARVLICPDAANAKSAIDQLAIDLIPKLRDAFTAHFNELHTAPANDACFVAILRLAATSDHPVSTEGNET